MTFFYLSGNIPEVRERLAIAVIIGKSLCIQSFKSQAGMGSRLHDLLFMVKINCLTSSVVVGLKLLNVVSLIASPFVVSIELKLLRILSILVSKKSANVLARCSLLLSVGRRCW